MLSSRLDDQIAKYLLSACNAWITEKHQFSGGGIEYINNLTSMWLLGTWLICLQSAF